MPDMSAHAALFRGNHSYTGYLSTPEEGEVAELEVTATPVSPVMQLSFTEVSGDYADIEEGMEIVVERGSAFIGRLRVAAGGATSAILQVNEVSRNRIRILAGDTLRVLRSFRVRDKLVAVGSASYNKDSRIVYAAQNSLVAPLVRDGGHYAQVWRGSDIAVPFYGSLSQPMDFTSNPPLDHAYSVFGPDTFSSSDDDPTFTFTQPGTYWVNHVGTDTDVDVSQTKRSVVVLDDNPIPCRIESMGASTTNPWTIRLRTFAGSGIERLPNGAMVLYHEDERFGGTTGSYGNRIPHRSRVKFVGYLIKHSLKWNWQSGELTFDVASPLARLSRLPGFSQALKQVLSPSSWQEYEPGLTTNALLVYLMRWHTTYMELYDVLLPAYPYVYPDIFLQQQTPSGQLAEIADAVDASVRADRTGTMVLRQNLNLVGETARDAAAVTIHLQNADILEVEDYSEDHEIIIAQLTGRGYAGDEPLEAVSGTAPAEGSDFTSQDRMLVLGQSGSDRALNERTGRHWQLKNKLKDGLPVVGLMLVLRGSYDFLDPAYDEWVLVTLNRTVAEREVNIVAGRFWLESVDVSHESQTDDNGTVIFYKRVRVTLWGESDGPAGETQDVIVTDTPPIDDFEEIDLPPDAPIDYSLPPAGYARIGRLFPYSVVLTSDFDSALPTWGELALPLDVSEAIHDGIQKPGVPTRLECASATKLRIYTDITSAPYAASDPPFTYAIQTGTRRTIQHERQAGNENWIPVVYYRSTGGLYYEGSIDGGANLQSPMLIGDAATVDLTGGTGYDQKHPGLYVDPHIAGTAYVVARDGGTTFKLFKTSDYGATWAVSTDYEINTAGYDLTYTTRAWWIERPYLDSSRIYIQRYDIGGSARSSFIRESTAVAGATAYLDTTTLNRDVGTYVYAGSNTRRGYRTCDADPNKLLLVNRFLNYSNAFSPIPQLSISLDGVNFTVVRSGTDNGRLVGGVIGGDAKAVYLWGNEATSGGSPIEYVADIDTWTDDSDVQDKSGTGNPDSGECLNLFGF